MPGDVFTIQISADWQIDASTTISAGPVAIEFGIITLFTEQKLGLDITPVDPTPDFTVFIVA